jgi:hypothetical protein
VAYAQVSDVKLYRGIASTETDDDTLIATLIDAAQSQIDAYCDRTFDATATSTRYFDAVEDVDGRRLYLDAECAQIVTITNGDSTTVASTSYTTVPRNETPYREIVIRTGSGVSWTYGTEPEDAIAVRGRWAYGMTIPAAIGQAAVRLAAYFYAQKDAQVFETTLFPDAGVMTVPSGMPRDVQELLRPFRRLS